MDKMDFSVSPAMIIVGFIMAGISSFLASKRGRNPYAWFAIGFFFGIFGIFAAFFASSKKKSPQEKQQEPKVPILKIDGPQDKFWYYLDPTHTQQGPMSKDALTLALKQGKVNLSTFVWHEEMSDWKPLKDSLKTEA